VIYESEIQDLSNSATSPDDIRRWLEWEIARKIHQHIVHADDQNRRLDDQNAAISYVKKIPDDEIEKMRELLTAKRTEGFARNWPLFHLFRGDGDKARLKIFLRGAFGWNVDLEPYLGRYTWDAHFYFNVIGTVPSPPYTRTYVDYISR